MPQKFKDLEIVSLKESYFSGKISDSFPDVFSGN